MILLRMLIGLIARLAALRPFPPIEVCDTAGTPLTDARAAWDDETAQGLADAAGHEPDHSFFSYITE